MSPSHRSSPARICIASAFLLLVLLVPDRWEGAALPAFPLEWPVILCGAIFLANVRASRAVRALVVALLSMLTLLKFADMASFASLGRPFNPAADAPLAVSALQLLRATFGFVPTSAGCIAAVALLAALVWAMWRSFGVLAQVAPAGRSRRVIGAAGLIALAVAGLDTLARAHVPALDPPGAATNMRLAAERVAMVDHTLERRRDFTRLARADPFGHAPTPLSMTDRDVLVLFVESYGRASFDNPLYAPTHLATLARAESELTKAGLASRSGFIISPTRGGQSWLAHLTFASGLWIEDQLSYQAALQSGRKSLFDFATEAGFHTLAVMPAITLPWPEAKNIGFETVAAARDLGYRGEPFDWVTMPDQFTLSQMERLLRKDHDRPLFVEAALISSHAPWTPLPHRVPWDEIGDGAVFDGTRRDGATPAEVWRDRDQVRDQYRKALDYALTMVFEFLVRQGDAAPLVIVLGDHQATSWIAGGDNAEVPVHVIGPAELVKNLEGWGWSPGLIPDAAVEAFGMDGMRDRLLRLLGAPPGTNPPAATFREYSLPARADAATFETDPEVLQ
jgi:hypothetical protein